MTQLITLHPTVRNIPLSAVNPAGADAAQRGNDCTTLEVVVFATSVGTLGHYTSWVLQSHLQGAVVINLCLLYQRPENRDATLTELIQWGFNAGRIHILEDDGIRDPDIYVSRFDGGIGADGAYAVPGLGGKHLYVFDELSVTKGGKPVEAKIYKLMRLMAGIPRESGMAVLFDRSEDRFCFAQHCIRTLDANHRDALIREALEDLQNP